MALKVYFIFKHQEVYPAASNANPAKAYVKADRMAIARRVLWRVSTQSLYFRASSEFEPCIIERCNPSTYAQCLKITEKVAFNMQAKPAHVYILSGQKFIKMPKNGPIWRVF